MSSSHHTNTNSETDIPTGEGFRYPPEIFTNSKFITTMSTSENELDDIPNRPNFIGEYCEKCYTQTHPVLNSCWCNNSDWSDDLNTNKDENPNLEPLLMPQTSLTVPPPGWSDFRRKTISEINANKPTSTVNSQASSNSPMSPEEFNTM